MEGLQANITATCPSAFHGATGQLFAAAVATVVAAHCTMFDGYRWPRDRAEEVIQNGPTSFDFIVVGAGTAGSALAGLLAESYPSWSILLVEAGDDPGLNSEVPAFLLYNQDISWGYKTKADNKNCLGSVNQQCLWSKGKAMGGSSSINAMLYVRGHPNDFRNWEKSGNPGWSYEEIYKYFEAIEQKLNLSSYKYNDFSWYDILDEAYKELGLTKSRVDKNESQIGTRVTKLLISNGKRLNTAKIYLKERDNLYVMKNTMVQKVILNLKNNMATGVELRHRNGIVMQIKTNKEIILSAGSIATPQILFLSGIGPKLHLNEKGIQTLIELPVGQNLQDHVLVPLVFKTNQHTVITLEMKISMLLEYMFTKTGFLSNIGLVDYMGFINTNHKNDTPDIQYFHMYFTKSDDTLRTNLAGFGYNEEVISAITAINKNDDIFGVYPTLLHPKSKGEIKLTNSYPGTAPEINSNYFHDPDDIETFLRAIKEARKLQQTETLKKFEIELVPLKLSGCAGFEFDSEEYWTCYIRHMAVTIFHPVGTAKMGPKDDTTSVVNERLLVHGLKNLRVVDASIMPSITSGNTMAPTLMVAEKAFDMIKKQYEFRDEL
ncbi:glucose dehydrogenase [FAD, quinone]-like [Ostrinia furnacalis]|uniref:glucose dehydrogenase [FAD, quinone]-like n=1 Tax=Ostrinia furnacalis TaxID=93504 RepID=UPI001039973D|nr:glucose dehydrogenase [FAD, quinone]-like [Ostrinia furnacalis]XP_028172929.1 glucose dehydrogenase [FAD, quinone]-like [Ostrinia furnacalis]